MADYFAKSSPAGKPIFVTREEFAEHWPYRSMSPAEYAAREAHRIGCMTEEGWEDKLELYNWLKEVIRIIVTPGLVEQYRKELLSPEEIAGIRQEQADIEKYGF